ncbi:MAG: hypothetical protein LUG50_07605, partial [Planctomycetaceae bacterium]|nr:hypothetical protein [Planctomycetaceae bacterium]
ASSCMVAHRVGTDPCRNRARKYRQRVDGDGVEIAVKRRSFPGRDVDGRRQRRVSVHAGTGVLVRAVKKTTLSGRFFTLDLQEREGNKMGKMPDALRETIARNIRECRLRKYPGRGGGKRCAESFGVSPQ